MNTKISMTATNVKSSSIREMFNTASKLDNVVNLGMGEPDFNTPPNILAAAAKAMQNGQTHYTSNVGNFDLREAVAKKLQSQNRINCDPESEVIITTGAMGGLFLSLQVLLDPGDEVILCNPSWTNYSNQILMAGGVPVYLKTDASSGFSIDPDRLKSLITNRTKVLILNTPSNPTGAVYSRETITAIAEIIIEKNMIVISDEVYEYFIWESRKHVSIASLPGMAKRTVTINSLSKTFSMTGWRIGYTSAAPEIIAMMVKLQENVYACVNSIAQAAALEALCGTQKYLNNMISEYRKRRLYMLKMLPSIPGLKCIVPYGTFYMVVEIDIPGINSYDFAMKLLTEAGVCVIPGAAFGDGGESFIRIAYTQSMNTLKEAISRIESFMGTINSL